MPTNAPAVKDATIQKFIDGVIASIVSTTGTAPDAAPNAFKDRLRQTILPTETPEFQVHFKVNPNGLTAWARVEAIGSRGLSIEGAVDLTVLATKLV